MVDRVGLFPVVCFVLIQSSFGRGDKDVALGFLEENLGMGLAPEFQGTELRWGCLTAVEG